MRLVAKAHVAAAAVDREFAGDPSRWFGEPTRVVVKMSDGSVHEGDLMLEHISPHPRVLDYFNRAPEAFITLFGLDGITLLNRHHVTHVHPFDDGAS
jgi:hypothetical protein